MVFLTDGSSHANGVQGEKDAIVLLEAQHTGLFGDDIVFVPRGGTTTPKDIIVKMYGVEISSISWKTHKSGTFDWVNSPASKYLSDPDSLKKDLEDIKAEKLSVEDTRKKTYTLFNRHIHSLDIRKVLEMIHERSPEYVIVNHAGKLNTFLHTEVFAPFYSSTCTYYLKSGKAITSAKIWCKDGDNDFDTHLRVRLTFNNGITAFMGTNPKNKTSVPVIKIQQDDVKGLLSRVNKLTL